MDFTTMTNEELEQRKSAIGEEINAEDADLDALESEIRGINAEIERRKAEEAKRVEIREAVANGAGQPIKEIKEEKETMTNNEIRDSKAYVDAYVEYLKRDGKDDSELRALLTENVSGSVPVPSIVEGRIRTAWKRAGLMDEVRKTYIRGNLKIGFELSASDAVVHTEGSTAVTAETLTFGTVTLIPESIKKLVQVSDEAIDLGGEELLDYLYDEISYKIAKKAQDTLIGLVTAASTTAATNAVSVAEIEADGTDILGAVYQAEAALSDEADNPVIVMNKSTYADFMSAQLGANYHVDPFDGLKVYFDNNLAALGTASTGDCWLVVGDFGHGAHANFPNGSQITLKYDDKTNMASDLVNILGRQYVGLGLVADKSFTRVVIG